MNTAICENKTITLECPKHGEYAGEVIKLDHELFGKKELTPKCPHCHNENEQWHQAEKEKQQKQRDIQKWQSMNIEPRFYESSFDNFNAYNPELQKNLTLCCAFAEKPEGKLIMLGENGNGKTHLAVSVLKKVGGIMYTAYEIGMNLRQSYGGDTKEWEVLNKLCTVPLLVIDEVEKIKDSEAKQNWMSYVVGKRYDRMLPLILIANCHVEKDCSKTEKPCSKCLEFHLENDVLSRIVEDGHALKFSSDDYRRKIRNSKFGVGSAHV